MRNGKFKTRLLSLFLIAIVSLTGYFVYHDYEEGIRKSKEGAFDRLEAIVRTGAQLIDGEMHQAIVTDYPRKNDITDNRDDIRYQTLQNHLLSIRNENKLESDVYTLIYNGKRKLFEFVVTSGERPYYRHDYQRFPAKLMDDFSIGGTLDFYESENGVWLSAFAPIKDSHDNVVAVLEADQDFRSFLVLAKSKLFRDIILSISIIIPFVILLFSFLRKSLRQQEEYENELQQKNEEIVQQNEVITSINNEIEKAKDALELQNQFLEITVDARTKELRQTNRELAKFLYHSSHDIQAPIASIKGLFSLLSIEQPNNQYVLHLKQALARLEKMVKTMQNIYTAKTKSPEVEHLSLQALVSGLSSAHQIRFQMADENPVLVSADPLLFELAISELVRNSIEYHDATNGVLEITLMHLRPFTSGNKVQLIYSDNGLGIPKEIQGELFSMFKRGTEKSDGPGMGLYIAMTALKRMGATLELIESNEKGTSFLIEINSAEAAKKIRTTPKEILTL